MPTVDDPGSGVDPILLKVLDAVPFRLPADGGPMWPASRYGICRGDRYTPRCAYRIAPSTVPRGLINIQTY